VELAAFTAEPTLSLEGALEQDRERGRPPEALSGRERNCLLAAEVGDAGRVLNEGRWHTGGGEGVRGGRAVAVVEE
jgi:hypothetical protein